MDKLGMDFHSPAYHDIPIIWGYDQTKQMRNFGPDSDDFVFFSSLLFFSSLFTLFQDNGSVMMKGSVHFSTTQF